MTTFALRGGLDAAGSPSTLDGTMLGQQIALETEAIEEGIRLYHRAVKEAVDRGEGAQLKPAERLLIYWVEPLAEVIRQEQRKTANGEYSTGRAVYGPVLCSVDPVKIAVCALHVIIGRCMQSSNGVMVSELAYAIGLAIIAQAQLDMLKEENRESFDELTARVKRLTPKKVSHWTNKTLANPLWNRRVCAHVGAALLGFVLEVAELPGPAGRKAFRHEKRISQNKERFWFRMCWEATRLIDEGHGLRQFMRPKHMPMIVPSFPWQVSPNGDLEGGYAKIRTPLVSRMRECQRDALRAADLTQTYLAIKAISAPGWKLNNSVNNVARAIQECGGGVAGIPLQDDKERPERPANYADLNDELKKAWKTEAAAVHRENVSVRSKRAEVEAIFAVIDRIQNFTELFFPHILDFRSRAYPVPQSLNRHGGDLARALLVFAKPVPLGETNGMYWIYVHAANCAGRDKISYEDRVAWVDSWLKSSRAGEWIGSEETIVDAAAETWAAPDIDKPFQFLAALLAIFDPEQAAVLPVQRDGVCNALQHLAAMSRDSKLASMVSMTDIEKPSSIYLDVTEAVREVVGTHLQDKTHSSHEEAAAVAGIITPKILKRPIMTKNYSVTLVGARNQIAEELRELVKNGTAPHLKDWKLRHKAAMYLARLTLAAIDRVCESASAIMAWETECAGNIAKAGHLVRWTTPIGFPVVQHYRTYKVVQINTILQSLSLVMKDDQVPVSVKRHVSGIVPNINHSFDATHMHMVSIQCYENGVDFGAVHDGYSVHAAHVSWLDWLIREMFIELHSVPRLQELAEQWRALYPGVHIPDPPPLGDFDLNEVRVAKYFFN